MAQDIIQAPRRALVTGAAGAIGKAIAEGLAARGFAVMAIVRTDTQGRELVNRLRQVEGTEVTFRTCDLASSALIHKLAAEWNGPLHLLVNNAATCPRRRTETDEGIEMQFAVNVLGYVRMIRAFGNILQQSAPARVVNVASYWAGGLNLNDLEFRQRAYDNDDAYRQSKQANRMLTRAFAERFRQTGVTVNCCHPGDVRSKLSIDLGFGGHESPATGAATPLFTATAPELAHVTGKYFAHLGEEQCPFAKDTDSVERLFRICEKYN